MDRTLSGDEQRAWMREHEDTRMRDWLHWIREEQVRGLPVDGDTLEGAIQLAIEENCQEGLKSGRLVPCPSCGETVAPWVLIETGGEEVVCPFCISEGMIDHRPD